MIYSMFPSTAAVAVTLFTIFALLSIPYPITALKSHIFPTCRKKVSCAVNRQVILYSDLSDLYSTSRTLRRSN